MSKWNLNETVPKPWTGSITNTMDDVIRIFGIKEPKDWYLINHTNWLIHTDNVIEYLKEDTEDIINYVPGYMDFVEYKKYLLSNSDLFNCIATYSKTKLKNIKIWQPRKNNEISK